TFKAVANSKNSLPFSSRLRTNTGIARGSRDHFLRSVPGLAAFMHTPPGLNNPYLSSTSVAKSWLTSRTTRPKTVRLRHSRPGNQLQDRNLRVQVSLFIRVRKSRSQGALPGKSASFCYTWVIPLAFFVDKQIGVQ